MSGVKEWCQYCHSYHVGWDRHLEESASSFAAPTCWTAPSDIPPDVAKKILAARDALVANNTNEAFYQLYSIADPTFASYEPWEILEKQSNSDYATGVAYPDRK